MLNQANGAEDLRSPMFVGLLTVAMGAVLLTLRLFPWTVLSVFVVIGPVGAAALRSSRVSTLLRSVFSETAIEERRSTLVPFLGFVLAVAPLTFLEWRDHYYFPQDDNFAIGPVAIAALRGAFSHVFPTWNPYQFLGQPTSVQSMYALTYPPTYVFFAILHWLGRDNLYLETFTVAHISLGYWATYWAGRSLKLRPVLAVAASISFTLSGTALMISRSYATMSPLLFWTPLLIVAAERLRRSPIGLKWTATTGLALGYIRHSDHAQ